MIAACLALLTGCASVDDPKYKRLSNPTIERPTVAALPFATRDYSRLQSHDRMVRDFERSYMPARLVAALRSTAGLGSAYFSPAVTPAADFNVKGSIEESNGKDTSIEIVVVTRFGKGDLEPVLSHRKRSCILSKDA